MKTLILLMSAVLFSVQAPALDDRIDTLVRNEILAKGVPAVSVAVMRDGKMVIERAWGVADIASGANASTSTTYQIASASKQFTAALVLKQVERGRLTLNDSIAKHLPGLKPEFAPITIEQLLNHTSGLPADYRNPARKDDSFTVDQLFAMANATSLANQPGTTFLYSNTGYFLLAYLVEKLHAKPFAAVLQEEIAKPLGLTLARCAEPRPGESTGYRLLEGKPVPPPGLHHSQLLGAGGICATAGDIAKWTHALHTGRVLGPAMYAAMTTPKGVAAKSNYGLGTYVRPAPWGGTIITHGGQSTTGHTSEMQWDVENKMAYAMLYNAGPRVPGIAELIPRAVLGVQPPPGELEERVDAVVKSEMLAKGIPSVSSAAMRKGTMLFERAWGSADIEKAVAAAPATVYPIGSVSKQFTAALVLKQVDRGRLALGDPIGKHIGGLDGEIGGVTIEQLLNHTSGLKRSIVDAETRFQELSSAAILMKAASGTLENKPGTTFTYSNAGYAILGVLVETLYGKKYAAVLQDEIARPLQLTSIRECAGTQPGDARGYGLQQGGKAGDPPGLHYSQYLGSGGVCATAGDLVRWTHALHTGRVLSPSSYQAMTTPRGGAASSNYGFGLDVSTMRWGPKSISHGGQSVTGHIAELYWFPEHTTAVALLYNVYPRIAGIADLIPRVVLGAPLRDTAPAPQAAAAVVPAERSKLVGGYQLTAQRIFDVVLENGELFVTPPGGTKEPLVFRSGNTYAVGKSDSTTTVTFIVENGVATAFEANADGNKRMLKKIR